VNVNPNVRYTYRVLAAALALSGRVDEARKVGAEMLRRYPAETVSAFRSGSRGLIQAIVQDRVAKSRECASQASRSDFLLYLYVFCAQRALGTSCWVRTNRRGLKKLSSSLVFAALVRIFSRFQDLSASDPARIALPSPDRFVFGPARTAIGLRRLCRPFSYPEPRSMLASPT
jgi:hypothetical protein